MAQELGDQLGGLAALRDSGAFVEVAALDNGGYWLRATESYLDFDLAAAERIVRVLRSVLLPGVPFPAWKTDVPPLVVLEDAAAGPETPHTRPPPG